MCSDAGWLTFDINGKKGPNQYGRDVFEFYIDNIGTLFGEGSKDASIFGNGMPWKFSCIKQDENIDIDSFLESLGISANEISDDVKETLVQGLKESGDLGLGCAGRIIEEGWKMNY